MALPKFNREYRKLRAFLGEENLYFKIIKICGLKLAKEGWRRWKDDWGYELTYTSQYSFSVVKKYPLEIIDLYFNAPFDEILKISIKEKHFIFDNSEWIALVDWNFRLRVWKIENEVLQRVSPLLLGEELIHLMRELLFSESDLSLQPEVPNEQAFPTSKQLDQSEAPGSRST